MTFLIPIIILVVIAGYIMAIYNSLASLKVRREEAWSQIDVQLKRRADLIPNLLETVKGYAKHEKELFENVTKARSALMSASTPQQAQDAENMFKDTMKSLFAVAESYPELKASDNFKQLQSELSDTESKIAYSRQFFNSVVRDFNSKIVTFPSNLVASMFGFKQETFFQVDESDRQNVEVKF